MRESKERNDKNERIKEIRLQERKKERKKDCKKTLVCIVPCWKLIIQVE